MIKLTSDSAKQNRFLKFGIALLFFATTVLSLGYGVITVPPAELLEIIRDIISGTVTNDDIYYDLIAYLRIPNLALAFLIGCGLAVCGTVMQAVMRNELADPFLMGISSGAGLGAVLSIALGLEASGVGLFAALGAFGASVLVLLIVTIFGKGDTLMFLLSGFAVNAACSSFMNVLITSLSDPRRTRSVQFWLMGSLMNNDWTSVGILFVIILAGTLFFASQYRILDLMVMGDELSVTLGRNLALWRKVYVLVTAVMLGAIVYMAGMIGFVGLLTPHFIRWFVGAGHIRLIPLCALGGGCFLVWADVIGRNAIPGVAFPIGVTASLAGAPLFLWMLLKGRWAGHHD